MRSAGTPNNSGEFHAPGATKQVNRNHKQQTTNHKPNHARGEHEALVLGSATNGRIRVHAHGDCRVEDRLSDGGVLRDADERLAVHRVGRVRAREVHAHRAAGVGRSKRAGEECRRRRAQIEQAARVLVTGIDQLPENAGRGRHVGSAVATREHLRAQGLDGRTGCEDFSVVRRVAGPSRRPRRSRPSPSRHQSGSYRRRARRP